MLTRNLLSSTVNACSRSKVKTFPLKATQRSYGSCRNKIIKTDSLRPIIQQCSQLDSKALVCLDVDRTLIVPQDPLAADIHYGYVRKTIEDELGLIERKDLRDHLHSIIYLNNKNRIIDSKSLGLVQYLNQRQIKTIALTALSRGPFGAIPDVLSWRLQDLRQLGYIFNIGFPDTYCFQFKDVVCNTLPAFKEGVLFSSTMCKGKITMIFLDRIKWRPSRVICVDDQFEHIESFTRVMSEMGIESTAYHYTGAADVNRNLDCETARLQIRHLIQRVKQQPS